MIFQIFLNIRSFRVKVCIIKNHQYLSWHSTNTDANFQLSALTSKYYRVSLEEGMHDETSNMPTEDLHPRRNEKKKLKWFPFYSRFTNEACSVVGGTHNIIVFLLVWIVQSKCYCAPIEDCRRFRGNWTTVILVLVSLVHSWFSIIVLWIENFVIFAQT